MARRINMDGYDSKPEYMAYNPDCPQCGEEMRYNDLLGEFKCPSCGYTMDESDSDFFDDDYDDDYIPSGCVACGGPYPSCKTSCSMFDD